MEERKMSVSVASVQESGTIEQTFQTQAGLPAHVQVPAPTENFISASVRVSNTAPGNEPAHGAGRMPIRWGINE